MTFQYIKTYDKWNEHDGYCVERDSQHMTDIIKNAYTRLNGTGWGVLGRTFKTLREAKRAVEKEYN